MKQTVDAPNAAVLTVDAEMPVTVRRQHVRSNHVRGKVAAFSILALAVVLVAVFAAQLCPYDPYAQDLGNALAAPSFEHWAGTDRYGRDLLSRVIMGAQSSIFSTLSLVAIIAVVGTGVGVVCGWRGGKLDTVLMRVSDVFLAFPSLVFALAVAGVLGGGMQNAVIALAAISWPKYARIARGLTLAQRNEPYVQAARMSGCSTARLIVRHLLPNIAGPVLVTAMLDIGTMMMELAGLSFLGLGAQPPLAEWGSMMSDNRNLMQTSPWTVIAPGVAIFITVMIFNLLGDSLRDWMDPQHRKTQSGGQGFFRSMGKGRVVGGASQIGRACRWGMSTTRKRGRGYEIGSEKKERLEPARHRIGLQHGPRVRRRPIGMLERLGRRFGDERQDVRVRHDRIRRGDG